MLCKASIPMAEPAQSELEPTRAPIWMNSRLMNVTSSSLPVAVPPKVVSTG